jgi:hypothetical protein
MSNDESNKTWADWSFWNGYEHATGANFSTDTGNDYERGLLSGSQLCDRNY